MKKYILALAAAAMTCSASLAQVDTLMRVSRADGRTHYIPITQIDKVDFVEKVPWTDPDPSKVTALDYFDIKVTRCERISTVLILDFTIENLTPDDQAILFKTYDIKSKDDLGNSYTYKTECALTNQGFATSERALTLDGYATGTGRIRITDFDSSNKATSVSITPKVTVEGKTLNNEYVTLKANITDKRPVRNGVQTCDKNLAFEVKGSERVGSVLIVDFNVTNNGSKTIENFDFTTYDINCKDDLGNSYTYKTECAFGKQAYSNTKNITLEGEETLNGRMRVRDFDNSNSAQSITIKPRCASNDYVLEDNLIQFLKLPISDSRVVGRGIQSCDRNLDFKLVAVNVENGSAIIDYTITNTGAKDIKDFTINTYDITCKDDLNNNYTYNTSCSFGNQGFSNSRSIYIEAGQTVTGHIKIDKFNSQASYVSLYPKVSSADYELDDPTNVSFMKIEIQ